METIRIELGPIAGVILGVGFGTWALSQGWRILRHGERLPTLGDRMAIWLLRMFKGQDTASIRLQQLTTPQKMRAAGIGALATGVILVGAGLLQLMGLILLYFS